MGFWIKCKPCKGHGHYFGSQKDTCKVCSGRGWIAVKGDKKDYVRCAVYKGHGHYFGSAKDTCKVCNGLGIVTKTYAE